MLCYVTVKNERKAQAGNEWSNILQKSSQARKKPALQHNHNFWGLRPEQTLHQHNGIRSTKQTRYTGPGTF